MKIKMIGGLLGLLLFTFQAFSQNPFEKEIRAFEQEDRFTPPPKEPILFVGSSSFRLWDNLKESFPDKTVLNRGFGGSKLSDMLYYYERTIPVYKPQQIIIYCGENDIAGDRTPEQAYLDFFKLYGKIRKDMPEVPVVFISAKPSPSRWNKKPAIEKFNRLVSSFLDGEEDAEYLDVWPIMLNENLRPEPSLFKPDSLHMNHEGYRRWTEALKPLLN